MEVRNKRFVPPRRYAYGQKAHEKILKPISHQRNANQNHSEVQLHAHWVAIAKKVGNNVVGRMWRN